MNWLYNGFIETALNAYCHINQQICGYRLVLYKITMILKKSTSKRIGTMNKCKVIGEHKNYHNTICNELARTFVRSSISSVYYTGRTLPLLLRIQL